MNKNTLCRAWTLPLCTLLMSSTFLAAEPPTNSHSINPVGVEESASFSAPQVIAPKIDSITPSTAARGARVVIRGHTFGSPGTVYFGSLQAGVRYWSNQTLLVIVPPGSGTTAVTVVTGRGKSNEVAFTYTNSSPPTPQPTPRPTPAPTVTPKPTVSPTPSPGSGSWDGTQIPFQLPGDLTALQADAILSLVSIAENSTTSWWNNYTYIEDIGDGRGYTINIVGFCTGTGDFLWLVEDLQSFAPNHPLVAYLPALRKVNGTASHAGLDGLPALIRSLGNDPDYLRATWDAIIYFYWGTAMDTAAQLGLTYPISKGQLYDIALNAGDLSILKKVKSLPPSQGGNEKVWLSELQSVWQQYITTGDPSLDSGHPDRALMWKSILATDNVDLNRPINNLVCYGDHFVIN